MKKLLILLLFFPFIAQAQLGDYNFYFGARFGYAFGLNDYEYLVSEGEDMYGDSISTFYSPGNSWVPELVFGIKMTRNFYMEAGYAYFANRNHVDFGTTAPYPEGYTFNRSAFLINAFYYVNITRQLNLYMGGGAAYYMPSKLHMEVLNTKETINYAGTFGMQGGFGFSYTVKFVSFQAGVRYRWETYQLKDEQTVSEQRLIDNPEMGSMNASAFDIHAGVVLGF